MRKLSRFILMVSGVNKVIEAHPQAFGGAKEDQGQKNGYGTAEDDECRYWHGLAGRQRHGDDDNQEFADDQVYSHRASVVARLAFEGETAHRAVFIGFEDAGEYFASATDRAALAQSPS